MPDAILDLGKTLQADDLALFAASTSANPQFYQVVGLFMVNFCHVEFGIDWLLAKTLRIDNLETFKHAFDRKNNELKVSLLLRDPRFGPEIRRRLEVFKSCFVLRNELSHAMCANAASPKPRGTDRLVAGSIGVPWTGEDLDAWPSKGSPTPFQYRDVVRRAAWLRTFQEDLFVLAGIVFVTPQARHDKPELVNSVDLLDPASSSRWEDVSLAQLNAARGDDTAKTAATGV